MGRIASSRRHRRARPSRRAAAIALAAAAAAGLAHGGDWPQWMGPERNGAVAAPGTFAGERVALEVVWRRPMPAGYSSVTVAGARAFALGSDEDGDWLVAFDAAAGGELWRHRLDAAGIQKASSTPAVGGGRVFALNGRGRLHAVAAADGTPLWSRDLSATLDAVPPSYGMSTSPLLVDGRVVVLAGGREGHNLVAFDQISGGVEWSVFHARRGSYASPQIATLAGERQIVVPADDRLYAVRPADGALLWSRDGLGYMDRIPLVLPGERLFLAQEKGAVMLAVRREGGGWRSEELWRSDGLKQSYSPAVFHQGSIFGFDGSSLTCLDAASGERRWSQRTSEGSLVLVDGHLLVLDAFSGRLAVVAARPDRYVERAAVEAVTIRSGAGAYASPSFAGGRIFVRGGEQIAAIAVRRPDRPAAR